MDDRWRFLDRWRAPETPFDPPQFNNLGGTPTSGCSGCAAGSLRRPSRRARILLYLSLFIPIGLGSLPFSIP